MLKIRYKKLVIQVESASLLEIGEQRYIKAVNTTNNNNMHTVDSGRLAVTRKWEMLISWKRERAG